MHKKRKQNHLKLSKINVARMAVNEPKTPHWEKKR